MKAYRLLGSKKWFNFAGLSCLVYIPIAPACLRSNRIGKKTPKNSVMVAPKMASLDCFSLLLFFNSGYIVPLEKLPFLQNHCSIFIV